MKRRSTKAGAYLRLCAFAGEVDLHVELHATNASGMFRLTVCNDQGRELSWAPALLIDLDVAAQIVLDELTERAA